MAIAFRSGSSAGNFSGGNLIVNKPSGVVDGDILIVAGYNELSGSAWTPPAGWTEYKSGGTPDLNNNSWINIWWKRASGEPANYTFNKATSWEALAISAFSGAISTGDPIDGGPTSACANNQTPFLNSITNANANDMNIGGFTDFDSNTVTAGTSGYSQGGNIPACEIWYALQAASGTSGSKQFGLSGTGTNGNWATLHFSIKASTGVSLTIQDAIQTQNANNVGVYAHNPILPWSDINVTGTGTVSSSTISHPANSEVVLTIAYIGTTSPSSVTYNTTGSITRLAKQSQSTNMTTEFWTYYSSASSSDLISVGFAASTRHAWNVVAYLNALSGQFEGLNLNSGSGASVQTTSASIAAGSGSRMMIYGTGGIASSNGSGTITGSPSGNLIEIGEADLAGGGSSKSVTSAIMQQASSASANLQSTLTKASASIQWASVAFALLYMPNYQLSINNATQTQNADNVVLTMKSLTIQDAIQAQTSDNLSFTKYYVINPVINAQNTTVTNALGPDGFTWAQGNPIVVDKYQNLIAIQRRNSDASLVFEFKNRSGSSWNDNLVVSNVTRASGAYDSANDLLHVLYQDSSNTNIIYRRYTITRNVNNITNFTQDSNVNLVLDTQSIGTEFMAFPVCMWLNDSVFGANGAVLMLWGVEQTGAGKNGQEIRSSMRILSNSIADNAVGNWQAPVTSSSSTLSGSPNVAYSAIMTSTGTSEAVVSANRKVSGSFIGDVFVAYSKFTTSYSYNIKRMKWNSSGSNWSNGLTSEVLLSNQVRSGNDGGYNGKQELITSPREDSVNNQMIVGLGTWKDNNIGDTWSYVPYLSNDTAGSIIDVYSASPTLEEFDIFITGDIAIDNGYIVSSYTNLPNKWAYVKVFDASSGSQVQSASLVFSASPTDIPTLYQNGSNARFNNGNGDKLLIAFRNFNTSASSKPPTYTPPYQGYVGTMDWVSASATPSNSLTINNSTQNQTADNVVLIQHNILVINNATQAQTSDNLSLTQHNVLNISNAVQLQNSDNLILVFHAALIIANAIQLQNSDNLSLTQHNVLSINNAIQLQTADNAVLTQHNVLVINNATQLQNADNLVLTYHPFGSSLTIQNATQAQTSDNLSLTQHNVLTINNAIQLQTSDNLTLSQHNVLVIQNATQLQNADNLSLAQHNVLSINNAIQLQNSDNVVLTQHNILVINNAIQLQTADNLILTQHGILTINNAIQLQNADNLVLTYHAAGSLSINNATQAQTAANLTLVQHNILSIQNAIQLQNADNVLFVPHITLTIQNATQLQNADNFILIQHNILVVLNAIQLQNSNSLVLIQHNILFINFATQVQTSDNLNLVQHNILSVGNAIQLQNSDNLILLQHNLLFINNAIQLQNSDNIVLTYHLPNIVLSIFNAIQLQISDNSLLTQHNKLIINDSIQLQNSTNILFILAQNLILMTIVVYMNGFFSQDINWNDDAKGETYIQGLFGNDTIL